MTLGERIGRYRKEMGISQEELGHRLGVSRQAVSKWETGRAVPDMENLLALARLFGVPLPELTDTPPEKTECPAPEQGAFSETETMPETTECPDTETDTMPETRNSLLRLWVVLGIAGLAVLFLCLGLPLLLLCWNRVEISDTPVEYQVPAEEVGQPEVSIQGPDNEPALPKSNNASTPPESHDTPAFSEPGGEPEFFSDAEKVYLAFNQLASGVELTAEEHYAFRRDLFACLPSMDWTEFARLGTTEEESDCIFALMNFLLTLEDYSAAEIYHLQRASANPGIDGAYAEFYAGVLSKALSYNPAAFVQGLACDDSSGVPWPYYALSLASFDLSYFPNETEQVEKSLQTALSDGSFTEEQSGWCRLLLLYLEETDGGDQSGLPRTPEEMQD